MNTAESVGIIRKVGFGVSVDKYLEAAADANSVFYTNQSWYNTAKKAPYYATDCSAFVSYAWGVSRKTTASIPQISRNIGAVTTANVQNIQVGDCLNSNSAGHVVLVTGLTYSGSTITGIEITEQTPPQLKRTNHTVSSLVSKYGNAPYYIQRYDGTVPAAPVTYTGEWVQSGGYWYYKDSSGNWVTGWKQISGIWYLFDSTGAMLTGWQQVNGTWYYFNDDGAMQIGWIYDNGNWYYANDDGAMLTGWLNIDGQYYYTDSSGAMITGWQNVDNKWYYFYPNDDSVSIPQGTMMTKWQKIENEWYYFDESGVMQVGWLQHDGNWYYLSVDGVMQTGWHQLEGNCYYFDQNGAMLTGWINIDGACYYADSDGVRQTGLLKIGTKTYMFASDGKLIYTVADINFDDSINANDLIMLKKFLLKAATLNANATSAADINGDGTIDLKDILRIRLYIANNNTAIG